MTSNPWILLYVPNNELEGHVVVSALEHAGVDAQLRPADRGGFGAALPTLDSPPAIWVRESDVEQAKMVIDQAADSESGRLSIADTIGGDLGLPGDE